MQEISVFRTVSGAAPSGDERAWLRWPPRSLRPSRGFGATPLSARVSAEAGQGTRCGVRCSAGLTQGLSDGCAEPQAGSAAPGLGRFRESGGKRAQRTVRQQIWVIVMAEGASQEVSGFAELIGERRYF